MTQTTINVEQWVEVFTAIGLEKADRQKWHREFEQRYPEGHQSFLEWLGLPVEKIQQIRQDSRG